MTRILSGGRRAAASGNTASAVVFLHGYGADGADLLGLADALTPHLPDTVFLAPNAPDRCANNPFGYQWFPIPWMDGSSEAEMHEGFRRSTADIDAYLERVLADESVKSSDLALFGFSQGTMMGLQVAPRRSSPLAAVVGFSGRLLNPSTLVAEARSKPPVWLAHGDRDEVVPHASLPEAGDALAAAGFDVSTYVMKGIGHGISPDGLNAALEFIRGRLDTGR